MTTASDPIEHASSFSFDVTVGRLVAAIEGAGMTVFARIDHAENAQQAGMTMPPATVLIYGAAKGGTPVMQAAPRIALDLPLRVLVREDNGRAVVSFHPVVAMLRQAGVPDSLAVRLEPAQQLLVAAIRP
jgi:uncharacterized protein (DUF302 family)